MIVVVVGREQVALRADLQLGLDPVVVVFDLDLDRDPGLVAAAVGEFDLEFRLVLVVLGFVLGLDDLRPGAGTGDREQFDVGNAVGLPDGEADLGDTVPRAEELARPAVGPGEVGEIPGLDLGLDLPVLGFHLDLRGAVADHELHFVGRLLDGDRPGGDTACPVGELDRAQMA